MVLKVYSVYDEKAQAYHTPYFFPNDGIAQRGFSDVAMDQKTEICRHKEDYSLYLIGEYDNTSAVLTPIIPPVLKARASDYKGE